MLARERRIIDILDFLKSGRTFRRVCELISREKLRECVFLNAEAIFECYPEIIDDVATDALLNRI